MTREEAVEFLSQYIDNECYTEKCQEAHRMAISALRPVSREQVEQIKGVWIFNDDWWEFRCSECHKGIGSIEKFKFCPHCGAPMTDEAVEITMRRLEALHEIAE